MEHGKVVLQKEPQAYLSVIVAVITATILAVIGIIYSWYLLTPMLLDYLATDAQSAGLSTEWRFHRLLDS